MNKKTDVEVLLEYIPAFAVWYKLIILYLFQFIIFILTMVFFWLISSIIFIGAILGQFIVSILLVFYFISMVNDSEKIREKYRKKYNKLAGQHFWYNYLAYINPIVSASFYFPILLKTDYFFPAIISLPSHFITNSMFPYYIVLPIGISLIIISLLIRRFSGDYGIVTDSYLYMIYPEKGRLITEGMYKYIRNPQYLCRGIMAIGFGFIANNIIAVLVGFIHFLSYLAIIPAEDKELIRRFGTEFESYKKNVPAFLPKYGNWKKFIKFIFIGEKIDVKNK